MSLKIAFFIRRIGPYHHARFKAAALRIDLSVIETRPASQEYPWKFAANDEAYQHYSLGIAPDPEKGFTGRVLDDKVSSLLEKIAPDVIVTTGWADQEYHAAILWAVKHNVPRVVISDSTEEDVRRFGVLEWLKKQLLRNFQSAIVAGKRSRDYLLKSGFSNEAIYQPWDVVDNDYFSEEVEKHKSEGHNPDVPYFLCVSRFIQKKNIPGLIEAYRKFRNETQSNCRLVIAGSGEMEKEFRSLINSYKLEDQVILPGFTQLEDLPQYYAHAEALMIPSFSDQWGLVVNEAMASGLPVLVSQNCGCADDIVMDGENGFVFNPHTIEDIKKTLLKFSQLSVEEKKEMGKKSKTIIQSYRIEDFATALENAAEKAKEKGTRRTLLPFLILNGILLKKML